MIIGLGSVSWALLNIGAPMEASFHASEKVDVESNFYTRADNLSETSNNIKQDTLKTVVDMNQLLPTKVFEEGEKIGHLEIPVLKRKIDLIEGTSAKSLKKGVGHFAQSVMPGVVDNCVISGHRDTFFKGIGKLKKGDTLIVETSDGTFTYEVSGTRIVHKDDKTVIVPTDHGVLTLTTCYPFRFIGNAPDRYIISADLIKSE